MKNQYLFPTILVCVTLVLSSLILSYGLNSFGKSFEKGMINFSGSIEGGMINFSRSIKEGSNDVKLGLMNSKPNLSIPSNIRFGIYNQGKPFEFKAIDSEAIETQR